MYKNSGLFTLFNDISAFEWLHYFQLTNCVVLWLQYPIAARKKGKQTAILYICIYNHTVQLHKN